MNTIFRWWIKVIIISDVLVKTIQDIVDEVVNVIGAASDITVFYY
mgnify:CR=1 FL=1